MRRPALLLLGVLAVPRAAHADDYSLHVLGNLQTSWTDNLLATEDDRESDLYTQLRPGALLSYETPRAIYEAAYNLEASLYARNDDAYSISHLATLRGFFLTSPRTELQTSAAFATGDVRTLTLQAAPTIPGEAGMINGNSASAFWSLDAGQGLLFNATRALRLSQGARVRRFSTADATGADSGGSELGLSVGLDRGWSRSALGFGLTASYVTLEQAATTTDSINSNLLVSFRRDFSPRWTALVDSGVAAVMPFDDQVFVQPTVGANLGYTPNWGQANLALRRAMAPNLYLAQNTITDSVNLNASLPLPWLSPDPNRPRLTTQGSIGVSRTQQIVDGALTAGADVASIDLAVQYNPRPGLTLMARGQYLRQVAEDVMIVERATPTFAYDRTTISLSLTFRFPDRLAAEVPIRDSLRVDRGGNTPVGDEVAPSVAP